MLSTLVLAPPFTDSSTAIAATLVRTLAALVPATVDGLVRDVTLVAAHPDADIRQIADYAGCAIVEADSFEAAVRQAVDRARSPWIFVLCANAIVDRGFSEEIAALFGPQADPGEPAVLLLRQAPQGFGARLMPDRAPVAGVIAQRQKLPGGAKDFATLVRRLGKARTLTSRAQTAF